MKEFVAKNKRKLLLFVAMTTATILLCAATVWAYYTPTMYVSIDVNPSIAYSVNMFDRVLEATAVNDDGLEILDGLNLENKTIDEAVAETVEKIEGEGYFEGENPGGIVISTSSEDQDKADQIAEDLQTAIEQQTEESEKPIEVEASSVALARVQQAKELGTTPGKLNLIQRLQASVENPDSIPTEEWIDKPVKQIMQTIKENKKAAKAFAKGTTVENDEQTTESTSAPTNDSTTPSDSTTTIDDVTTLLTEDTAYATSPTNPAQMQQYTAYNKKYTETTTKVDAAETAKSKNTRENTTSKSIGKPENTPTNSKGKK